MLPKLNRKGGKSPVRFLFNRNPRLDVSSRACDLLAESAEENGRWRGERGRWGETPPNPIPGKERSRFSPSMLRPRVPAPPARPGSGTGGGTSPGSAPSRGHRDIRPGGAGRAESGAGRRPTEPTRSRGPARLGDKWHQEHGGDGQSSARQRGSTCSPELAQCTKAKHETLRFREHIALCFVVDKR